MIHLQDRYLLQSHRIFGEKTLEEASGPNESEGGVDHLNVNTLQAGRWHPDFPYQSISVSQAIKALEEIQYIKSLDKDIVQSAAVPASLPDGSRESSFNRSGQSSDDPLTSKSPGNPALPGDLLEYLKTALGLSDRIVHEEHLPSRAARFTHPSSPMCMAVQRALAVRGSSRMFSHQAEAVDSIISRHQHTVIATATASGK